MKIQITLKDLEQIIQIAKKRKNNDSSLSETIELVKVHDSETHCGNDSIEVNLKSGFAECYSTKLIHIK
jgi:hypothetical protein